MQDDEIAREQDDEMRESKTTRKHDESAEIAEISYAVDAVI